MSVKSGRAFCTEETEKTLRFLNQPTILLILYLPITSIAKKGNERIFASLNRLPHWIYTYSLNCKSVFFPD